MTEATELSPAAVEAAVTELRHVTASETAAWNTWNYIATSAPIRAALLASESEERLRGMSDAAIEDRLGRLRREMHRRHPERDGDAELIDHRLAEAEQARDIAMATARWAGGRIDAARQLIAEAERLAEEEPGYRYGPISPTFLTDLRGELAADPGRAPLPTTAEHAALLRLVVDRPWRYARDGDAPRGEQLRHYPPDGAHTVHTQWVPAAPEEA